MRGGRVGSLRSSHPVAPMTNARETAGREKTGVLDASVINYQSRSRANMSAIMSETLYINDIITLIMIL